MALTGQYKKPYQRHINNQINYHIFVMFQKLEDILLIISVETDQG